MKILVITPQTDVYKEVNNFLIPRSLLVIGHEVVLADVDSLTIRDGVVCARMADFTGGSVGDKHVRMDQLRSCEEFDVIWLLDYSHPSREKEFFQILWVLEQRISFVNSPSSMFFINNKIGVLGLKSSEHFPVSNVVLHESEIRDVVYHNPGKKWVIKPPNGGCGASVFVLSEDDPNFSALIQSSTGNAYQKYEMHTREAFGQAESYAILQRFIPEMAASENRVIVSGGNIVGGYKKTPTGSEFRGNYAVGGVESELDLPPEARELCLTIGAELRSFGINYVGIDLAFPYIVEYNLVNPGGISGQLNATGEDIGVEACRNALESTLAR